MSKKPSSKKRKDSSSSSESDSESEKSSSSSSVSSDSSGAKSKSKKYSKSAKPTKRDHSLSDEGEKNVKVKKGASSRWDSPDADSKSKPKPISDEDITQKKSHDKPDKQRNSRDRDRERSGDKGRDRSYEDKNHDRRNRRDRSRERHDSRDRKDNSRDKRDDSKDRRDISRDRKDDSRNRGSYEKHQYRRSRDRSPFRDNRRNFNNRDKRRNDNFKRRRNESPEANYAWGRQDGEKSDSSKQQNNPPVKTEKEKPNFGLSGKLTEETNTYKGVVIKYSEPPEARKPKRRWRLYPFKGEKAMQTLYIHRQSAYLIGRDRKIADLPIDHPSCSKQHAVLQYRLVPFERDDGSTGKRVRPYIIDLESANGTFINNNKIDPKKYVELLEKDVIKFGFSSREYVLLHENSKDEADDDDVKLEEEDLEIKQEPKD